ncbi:MAG: hypothetical protein IPL99_12095 [Candidatus Competibacteraceae bacterium]|nr:hypothetical protein [Candidatus Competibacteraceae bacterium]
MIGREALKRVEAESQQQREEHNTRKAELDGIVVHRKEAETRLNEMRQDLANLDNRRAEIEKIRDELTEGRIQQAELLRDLAERHTEYNELVIAAERARAQIALFDERKAEIEALATAEHEARTRLTEARGELDYTNRQLAVARVETERRTAECEKYLVETQRIEEKKTQLQNELARLQQERDPLATELQKTRQELETVRQDLKTTRQQGQELEEELAHWRTMRGATEVATETARAELMKLQAELEPARQAQALAIVQLQSTQYQLAENENHLRKQAEDIARLNTMCVSYEAVVATKRVEIESLQAELLRLQEQCNLLAVELDKTREDLTTANQELTATRKRQQDFEDDLANLRFVRASIEATTATTKAQLESVQIELEKLQQQREPLVTELAAFETATKQRQALEDELAGLQTQRITAEVTLNTVRMDLENIQNQLEKSQKDRDSFENERESAYQELENARRALTTMRGQSQEHQEELANLRALRVNIEATMTANREAVEAVQAELEELQEERDPLSAELENVRREIITGRERRQELEEELAGLYATRAIADAAVATTREAIEIAQAELVELQPHKIELESLRRKIAEVRNRQQELDDDYDLKLNRLNKIKADIQAQSGGIDKPELDNALADLVRPPACLSDQAHIPRAVNEQDALKRVREHLKALDLHFPERTLYAFHTALKTATISPLTVLAGISGTGKSQLPRRYAEAMGIHFLKIPVQPGWDSPQDMLGFYNYLEKRYKATELARALVHFDPHNWPDQAERFKDRLLLVLLDEMNLARVEYYFSEFLSQLEGRPAPGQLDMDGIRKSEIALDIGGTGGKSYRIYPGHNMLFVGTMNEDESTQTLSDKVLDRANLLRFPRPNQLVAEAFTGAGTPVDAYLPAGHWHGWRRRISELPDHLCNKITALIHQLNSDLGELHRPFAHRVNQAMLAYIANYPGVAKAERGDGWESARLAFADQLELRILPKLRGVDLGDASMTQPLRQIGDLIKNELHDEALYTAFQRASEDDGSGRPFIWMGVRREDAL